MAVNVSVFDLENFPNNPKVVTVDLTELTPTGNNGEDTWVFSAITTATASGGAAIQRLYINDTKFGWARSSGLKQGPYTISSGKRHLKVAIDENIGSGVEIALEASATNLSGETVAKDMQKKINQTADPGGTKEGNLAYLNATVRFTNGTFEIISGTAGDLYIGSTRTSVEVADGTTTTGLAEELGLDVAFTSKDLTSNPPKHTNLDSDYTSGTSLTVGTSDIISGGDCIAITDGTNTEFRGVESGVGSTVTLSSGLANSYDAGSLIQVLSLQDPTGQPSAVYTNVDDYIKFAISSIVNQIDFSS